MNDYSGVKLKQINELVIGKYFGELSLLTNERRTATCFALEKVSCGWIANEDF